MIKGPSAIALDHIEILIVEDNKYMQSLLRTVLKHLGVQHIHQAYDGADALNMLKRCAPDIILLDWVMPFWSGEEFMQALRSSKATHVDETKILVVTAHATRDMVLKSATFGIHGIIAKPIAPRVLYTRIVEALRSTGPILVPKEDLIPTRKKISPDAARKEAAASKNAAASKLVAAQSDPPKEQADEPARPKPCYL